MFTLEDEQTVPSLAGALEHYLLGDADYHFNRKVIYALVNIGSNEAIQYQISLEWSSRNHQGHRPSGTGEGRDHVTIVTLPGRLRDRPWELPGLREFVPRFSVISESGK